MPELPEVETVRRQLEPLLVGATFVDAWAFPSHKFADAPLAVGGTVHGADRRGKYLLFGLTGPWEDDRELVVHLGMTGRLAVEPEDRVGRDDGPHLRAWWTLRDGRRLTFTDIRRFGRVAVVPRGRHDDLPTLAMLGPEPLGDDFTPEVLRRAAAGRRAIKTVLLSQRAVAGVGNIYADEALWLARIHPRARRLGPERAVRLRDAIRNVLEEGLAGGGTTLRDYRNALGDPGAHQERLRCYGRAGLPCDRCGTTLEHDVVDARSTTWCPVCQRR